MDNEEIKIFPLALKVTAVYLIIVGGVGLIWPLLGLGPYHPEFEVQTTAFKVGAYFRESIINMAFLVAGIGVFLRKYWGRTTGLVALAISSIYAGNSFAWGFENGPPNNTTLIVSYLVTAAWNGIWFYILIRKSTVATLN